MRPGIGGAASRGTASGVILNLVNRSTRLTFQLHPGKTRIVNMSRGKESFEFLGCTIRKRRSIQRNPRWHFVQRWPAPKAMKRIRQRVHELTDARHSGARDLKQIITGLNPVLRGWGNYFRSGNADAKFNQIDGYVHERIQHWLLRRGGQRRAVWLDHWPQQRLYVCEKIARTV